MSFLFLGSRIGRQPNSVKHATMIQLQQIKVAKGLPVEFEIRPKSEHISADDHMLPTEALSTATLPPSSSTVPPCHLPNSTELSTLPAAPPPAPPAPPTAEESPSEKASDPAPPQPRPYRGLELDASMEAVIEAIRKAERELTPIRRRVSNLHLLTTFLHL